MKLRRGAYVERTFWDDSDSRTRHVLRMQAVLAAAERPMMFAGASAAALWGMPIAGDWPEYVTVLDKWAGGGRSEPGVRRTAAGFSTARGVLRGGMPTTTLARTAIDVARHSPFASAVASVDWALWRKNPAAVTKDELVEEIECRQSLAGRRHLRSVVGFASPLSDSFGESMCRVMIHALGFASPELQVVLRDEKGAVMPDFLWPAARVAGEFDGKVKYVRSEYTGGDAVEALWAEKKREDRVRAHNLRVVRMLTEDVVHPVLLERKLVRAGVPRAAV